MNMRNRLTTQAIADVQKAETASLLPSRGGYKIELCKNSNCVRLLDKLNRSVVYTSQDSAKKALLRHNPSINISLKSRLDD